MITEKTTIKVNTDLDKSMQKELSGTAFKLSVAFIIVGAIGVAAFLIMEIASIFIDALKDEEYFIYLILFAVFLGAGIGLLAVLKTAYKNVTSLVKVNCYEFYSDCFTVDQAMNGEIVAHAKLYYNQITKSKESKNYLFIYVGAAGAYPVLKSALTEAELNTLKSLSKLKFTGETLTLPPYAANEALN